MSHATRPVRFGHGSALTRIYTRTGDDGTSGLSDFSRVAKSDPRLIAYADCDEANAALGVAVALGQPGEELRKVILQIPERPVRRGGRTSRRRSWTTRVSAATDHRAVHHPAGVLVRPLQRDAAGPELVHPSGGTALSALLHVARTVVRRAERSAWIAVKAYPETISVLPARYLNRLSDLLFILSRVANPDGDVLWQPGGANAEGPQRRNRSRGWATCRRAAPRGDGRDSTQDRNAVNAPRSRAISSRCGGRRWCRATPGRRSARS